MSTFPTGHRVLASDRRWPLTTQSLEALAADVFGSPVYVLEGEVFWGQDRLELLEDALKSGRAPYSSKV